MKILRKVYFPLAVIVLIALNQLSRLWIVNHITLDTIQECLPGIFSLTYLCGYGAALLILQNQQWSFVAVTPAVVGAVCYYSVKNTNGQFWSLLGPTLIISGGLGNFIDRVHLGYVVDMTHLDFMNFVVFDMADSYLTVGVVILFITFWEEEENGVDYRGSWCSFRQSASRFDRVVT